MKKKEKKSEWMTIWKLIKNLMDKKWIPRWDNRIVRAVYDVRHKIIWLYEDDWKEYFELVSKKSLRELVSTDSWLWQFVCENRMVEHRNYWIDTEIWQDEQYKYRLIESALCDEDKLEEFLLENIKL
jgi:hypothetical protein